MLTVSIENKGKNLMLKLPCSRRLMAEQLASIGIRKSAHEIKCTDEGDESIKVKIFGESEFENKLASLISPTDTLSFINTMCEVYQNLPYQNKLEAKELVVTGGVSSAVEFGKEVFETRVRDTTEYFYCPLVANVFCRDEHGNLEDYPDEYDGRYLAPYEEQIHELIRMEDSRDENNLAAYFDGSRSVAKKLKELHFSTQNVDGVLYGCIRVELTSPFKPVEEAEFKGWLEGQCSDGYGEGLEQRTISLEDGEMCVSFWNGGDDWFLLNGDEFDDYLCEQKIGCM